MLAGGSPTFAVAGPLATAPLPVIEGARLPVIEAAPPLPHYVRKITSLQSLLASVSARRTIEGPMEDR